MRLRNAKENDAPLVYAWRNAEQTRAHFFDTNPITLDEHCSWFIQSLAAKDRHLLIVEENKIAVGVLRFDINNEVAEVSIYLNPEYVGKGLGNRALQAGSEWVEQNLPQVKKCQARIMSENKISQRAFSKANFNCVYHVYEREIR